MSNDTPNQTDELAETRPCAGCGKAMVETEAVVLHKRSVGDAPFCSQECADRNLERVWKDLP